MVKRVVLLLSLSIVVILTMLNFTNPLDCGPLGVLVFFTTLYLFFCCVVFFFVRLFRLMISGKGKKKKEDIFYVLTIGAGPILMLLMRAFNISGTLVVGLSLFFVILVCILIENRFSVVK